MIIKLFNNNYFKVISDIINSYFKNNIDIYKFRSLSSLQLHDHVTFIFDILKYLRYEDKVDYYTFFATKDCPPSSFDIDKLKTLSVDCCCVEVFDVEKDISEFLNNKFEKFKNENRILVKILQRWDEVIGSNYIPFDMEERRDKLSHAYKELDYFIKCHEAMKKKGVLC